MVSVILLNDRLLLIHMVLPDVYDATACAVRNCSDWTDINDLTGVNGLQGTT